MFAGFTEDDLRGGKREEIIKRSENKSWTSTPRATFDRLQLQLASLQMLHLQIGEVSRDHYDTLLLHAKRELSRCGRWTLLQSNAADDHSYIGRIEALTNQ